MTYDNNMSGVLFRNKKKEHEKQPDHQGQCEINGVEMWISAWIKDGPKGKFFSLRFKPKDEQEKPPAKKAPAQAAVFDDMPDDIPF